jgi:HEAT repeat protein
MTKGFGLRAIAAAAFVGALTFGAHAVTEPPPEPVRLGLYEWMGTAPIVVAADVIADDGKYVVAIARSSVKGGTPPGTTLLVDLRGANRDRAVGVKPLDLSKGHAYLLLLKPSRKSGKEPQPVFDIVRGLTGARELPLEGADAVIDAATRLGRIQERRSDEVLWESIPEFLEDPNPVLVDASLELVVKFRRENLDLIPVLAPLLESPRPDVRRRAVVVVGRLLARPGSDAVPERGSLVGELTGRARRDDDPLVRRAAVAALAVLRDSGIDETLRTISHDDPDQDVRFEAEKALFDRKESAQLRRSD